MRILRTCTVLVLLLVFPCCAGAVAVQGKVIYDQGFVAGAKVSLYTSFFDMGRGAPAIISEPVEKGLFSIEVPEGSYIFTARGRHEGKEYFCYHPANPVTIADSPDISWIPLFCTEAMPVSRTENFGAGATIKGIVTFGGEPLENAVVRLYEDNAGSLKGIGTGSGITDGDGKFSIAVQEGGYIAVAVKRASGQAYGPPGKGDYYCFSHDNPVRIRNGQEVSVTLPCVPVRDVGVFVKDWSEFKHRDEFQAAHHERSLAATASHECGLRGLVKDGEGRFKRNIVITARPEASAEVVAMTKSDDEGRYFLPLAKPGLYNLLFREQKGEVSAGDTNNENTGAKYSLKVTSCKTLVNITFTSPRKPGNN